MSQSLLDFASQRYRCLEFDSSICFRMNFQSQLSRHAHLAERGGISMFHLLSFLAWHSHLRLLPNHIEYIEVCCMIVTRYHKAKKTNKYIINLIRCVQFLSRIAHISFASKAVFCCSFLVIVHVPCPWFLYTSKFWIA